MSPDAWISLVVTVVVFATLLRRRNAPPDVLFLAGVVAVVLFGVITPRDAFEGFANTAVLTIGALFIVAEGLRSTGVLDWVGHKLLGRARTEGSALARLAMTVPAASAFMITTPIVAMLSPVVVDWCRQRSISPSRLLIPVSFLAILGGVCTLIGTSTTLVVNGLVGVHRAQAVENGVAEDVLVGLRSMGFFEIGMVGLPCAIVGTIYMLLFARRLLPDRTELIEKLGEERREYLVEMLVQPECRLIGQTVEAAGLRHLPGLFLIEIDRDSDIITPVTPEDVIRKNDRLIFTGVVATIVDLEKIPGLVPAADRTYEFHPSQRQLRHLTEAVVSISSPLVGRTVREANFRQLYNAAVVAVHRNGERLTNKIGDIQLQPGDTLLLQTRTEFAQSFRNSRDFSLVSVVEGAEARRHDRVWIAAGLVAILVVWMTAVSWLPKEGPLAGIASYPVAAITIAGLMIATRCVQPAEARAAIDLRVLLTIVGALGLGRALTVSGAAERIAGGLVSIVGDNPMLLLAMVYLVSMVFTEMVTNNGVVAMLIPISIAVAAAGHLSPRPFIMAVAIAASLSFITPIGYQANLMVMGPGGYRPSDYMKVGLPLALLMAITALLIIPNVWAF